MGNVVKLSGRDHAEREAARWIARLDGGELSDEDRSQFERWLKSEPSHGALFEELGGIWQSLNALAPTQALITEPAPLKPSRARRWTWAVATAAALGSIAIAVSYQLRKPDASHDQWVTTQVGEHKPVKLQDGSTVVLNTDSTLQVNYSGSMRALRLIRGEAYFDVKPDPTRPFVVHAGQGAVRAIGTAFSISYEESDTIEVKVSSGRVQISAPSTGQAERDDVTGLEVLAAIDAGQRARFDQRIQKIEPIAPRALSNELAWRDGMLSLDGRTLGDAVQEIGRYTDIRIFIEDPQLRSQPVGGLIRLGDTKALLSSLEGNFGLQADWVDPRTVRLRTRR